VKRGSSVAFLGLLVVAMLVVVGCGGGDETTALTKAEFVKQANAACAEGKSEREKDFNEYVKTTDPSEVTKANQESLVDEIFKPPYEQSIEAIKSLGAPEGDEQQVEAITAAMEDGLKQAEAKPLVTLRTNVQFAKANALAVKYGLTDCVV